MPSRYRLYFILVILACGLNAIIMIAMSPSHAAEPQLISTRCAWAIRAALSEFEIWYKKNFSSGNDFPIATKMYAEVQCVEESDGIRVSFFPPVNTAGGNVSFMLNNEFIVINRAYGR